MNKIMLYNCPNKMELVEKGYGKHYINYIIKPLYVIKSNSYGLCYVNSIV